MPEPADGARLVPDGDGADGAGAPETFGALGRLPALGGIGTLGAGAGSDGAGNDGAGSDGTGTEGTGTDGTGTDGGDGGITVGTGTGGGGSWARAGAAMMIASTATMPSPGARKLLSKKVDTTQRWHAKPAITLA